MKDELKHYGTPRHSGRYPYGSGDDPNQRSEDFLGYVSNLRKKGLSDVEIAKSRGITTTEFRAKIAIEGNKRDAARAAMAYRLKEKGYSVARRTVAKYRAMEGILPARFRECVSSVQHAG